MDRGIRSSWGAEKAMFTSAKQILNRINTKKAAKTNQIRVSCMLRMADHNNGRI